MTDRIERHGLRVAATLQAFIDNEALPGTGLEPDAFWRDVAKLYADLTPRNQALLAERDRLQSELDTWHRAHPGAIADAAAYRTFLEEIGYLVAPPETVQATTQNVD
ncbi:MAG: malate synthase G, partial [Achromobacter sp.]